MKLAKAFRKGIYLPAIFLAGWFFSCLLLLAGSAFLLWHWSVIFPQRDSVVLASSDQQPPLPDERIALLKQFLNEQSSPLASQAAVMIEASETYKFDWRLLAAIAGKESSFGQKMPWDKQNGQSSHNAWGWGVYEDKAPIFSSWEEAIATVAEGLREEYYNKGYITPEIIMKKFTPRSDGSWARDVKAFMEQIAPEKQEQ